MAKSTVLIVESEAAHRKAMRQVVAKAGYHVLEAGSAKAAYRLLQSSLVEAIVICRFSPVNEIVSLAKAIKTTPAAGVPVIACAEDRVEQFVQRVGGRHGLPRPPAGTELADAIGRALEAAKAESIVAPDMSGRRRHPRYVVRLPVAYRVFGKGVDPKEARAVTRDVSAGGCAVVTAMPPKRGARLALTIGLPGRQRMKVGGTVVWSVAAKEGQSGSVGVQWIGACPDIYYAVLADLEAREFMRNPRSGELPPMESSLVTGSPKTGVPKTGVPKTGSPKTGSPKTGSPEAGAPEAGAPRAGVAAETVAPAPSAGATPARAAPAGGLTMEDRRRGIEAIWTLMGAVPEGQRRALLAKALTRLRDAPPKGPLAVLKLWLTVADSLLARKRPEG